MRIRTNIFPKTMKESLVMGFLIVMLPLYYYVELFVVIPSYYKMWSHDYIVHFVVLSALTFMIYANLFATALCDTSIKGRLPAGMLIPDWKYCEICQISAPPRSWHCNVCKTCILKRDHHCFFINCCIGFDNHRYFFMYLLYMVLSAVYTTYFNLYYIWDNLNFEFTWKNVFKLVFPLLAIFFIEWGSYHFYLIVIFITLLVGFFCSALLVWYSILMIKSVVTFEKWTTKSKYDRGILNNIEIVLGNRWYLVWLGPWVESTLPCDGMNWDKNESAVKE